MMRIISILLIAIVCCLTLTEGIKNKRDTAETMPYYLWNNRPRATRGFKNVALSTARGFGKRSYSNYYENNIGDDLPDEQEGLSVDWFVGEINRNPLLARYIVNKFIDTDNNGILTPKELLIRSNTLSHTESYD